MNTPQIFNFEQNEVRTVLVNEEPYFVGKDIAEILGYSNTPKAIRDHVDEEDKTQNDSFTVNGTALVLINESGLYSLILKSKLPSAKKFKRWVTSEVLPSVSKCGIYAIDEVLNNPDMLIAALTDLKTERDKRKSLSETVYKQESLYGK